MAAPWICSLKLYHSESPTVVLFSPFFHSWLFYEWGNWQSAGVRSSRSTCRYLGSTVDRVWQYQGTFTSHGEGKKASWLLTSNLRSIWMSYLLFQGARQVQSLHQWSVRISRRWRGRTLNKEVISVSSIAGKWKGINSGFNSRWNP